ncbi:helix-turn-helix domain-containing protein [Gilvimarinus sp. SDUM040013]|uniref:Helix-turn-helix domain-containing protein n=1 Tax=Gilvimarinus gilvus TaxID=3058038 RepID=A0ABU4S771_9GAMM|nr:helix-turn-helix domain-containing protein [Gilvimarinus sp. SDUM040013]MDO3387526.1 helix-turn-helix domain-containing protein [Gilvimarinus sp. SDUM040013]MDX6851544.1 helix-turn-helix domain-containing protein [Gilvimarinus sp. SDUM040013]
MGYAKDHKFKSKNRILKSAVDLFSRYGFDRVSIGQIMRAAKMTHGAFYAHFDSKEALFKASFLETVKGCSAARLVKGPLSVKHLTELVTHFLNLRELDKHSKPGPETVLFNEIGNTNANVKHLFEQSYSSLKKMVETRLIALSKIKNSAFASDRQMIAEKSRTILSLLIGAVVVAKTVSCEQEQQSILEAAQNQILILLGAGTSEVV